MHALVAVPDLRFQSRIEAALRDRQVAIEAPLSGERAQRAAADAGLLIVDLQAEGFDVPKLIMAARAAGARVLAFGRHTDVASLRAARAAGADVVVPRSQLAEELPALLDRLLATRSAGEPGGRVAMSENESDCERDRPLI